MRLLMQLLLSRGMTIERSRITHEGDKPTKPYTNKRKCTEYACVSICTRGIAHKCTRDKNEGERNDFVRVDSIRDGNAIPSGHRLPSRMHPNLVCASTDVQIRLGMTGFHVGVMCVGLMAAVCWGGSWWMVMCVGLMIG